MKGGRVRGGRLRKRLQILQLPGGAGVQKWVPFTGVAGGYVWASVEPQSGSEQAATQLGTPNLLLLTVEMRYLAGVKPRMRLTFDGRTLEIDSVEDVESRKRKLSLSCREVTA